MESEACVAMAEEGSAIQSVLEVQSQKTAQASSADLNQKAYLATAKVIRGLEASEKALATRPISEAESCSCVP